MNCGGKTEEEDVETEREEQTSGGGDLQPLEVPGKEWGKSEVGDKDPLTNLHSEVDEAQPRGVSTKPGVQTVM